MSAGTSVIVAIVVYLVLMGVQFLVAWRFPAGEIEPGALDDIAIYYRPFGHVGWNGCAGLYGPWGQGHWFRRPGEQDPDPQV